MYNNLDKIYKFSVQSANMLLNRDVCVFLRIPSTLVLVLGTPMNTPYLKLHIM